MAKRKTRRRSRSLNGLGDAQSALASTTAINSYVRMGKCEDALIAIENAQRHYGQEQERRESADFRAMERVDRAFLGAHNFFIKKCLVGNLKPSLTKRAIRKRARASKAYRESMRRRRFGRPTRDWTKLK